MLMNRMTRLKNEKNSLCIKRLFKPVFLDSQNLKEFLIVHISVAAPATKNWGDEGGWGVQGRSPRTNFWDHALSYARKRPFYRQGTPMFTAGGMLFKCNSMLRSSETVKILGFMMNQCCKQSFVCRYGSNETLVSPSNSDMSQSLF